MSDSRTFFEAYLPRDDFVKTLADPDRARQLTEDCVEVCVALGKDWRVTVDELFRSLRPKGRWKPYTLRSKREWSFPVSTEPGILSWLKQRGFKVFTKPGRGVKDYKAMWISPTREILKNTPKETIKRASKINAVLAPIECELDVEELIDMLSKEKDQGRKRVIRAKLRRMGHKGGLRGK